MYYDEIDYCKRVEDNLKQASAEERVKAYEDRYSTWFLHGKVKAFNWDLTLKKPQDLLSVL